MKLKTVSVYLIGFSGSGKSSVGRQLAPMLKARFYDTDQLITRRAGRSIGAIFAESGERYFRAFEETVVRSVVSKTGRSKVVALGGGAFENPRIRKMTSDDGAIVYLSCSRRELRRRIGNAADRPVLAGKKSAALALDTRIKTLLTKRLNNYHKADVTLSTTARTASQAARELKRKILKLYAGS
ncbi:MAG: shikimate kinase [Candidatus Zixiibacteriota bacterium]|nr:MAG: shikimate kinase [candidate division Zixibacteria bacterium]